MPFGENVGQAYVRIIADGSGMDEQIRRDLENTGKVYDHAGKKNSERYADSFARNLESGPNEKTIQNAFDDQLAHIHFGEKFFKGKAWKDFEHTMVSKHGQIGGAAAARLERDFNKGLLSPAGLKSRMGNIDALITASTEEVMRGEKESNRRQYQLGLEHLAEMTRIQRMNVTRDVAYAENEKRIGQDRVKQFKVLNDQVERMARGEKQSGVSRNSLLDQLFRSRLALRDAGPEFDHMRKRLKDLNRDVSLLSPNLAKMDRGLTQVGDVVGKGFGKGSRNNFFNFIGSVAGAIPNLLGSVVHLAGGFGILRRSMALASGEAFLKTGSRIRAAMAGLGEGLSTVGGLFLKLGGAVAGLTFLVGPLLAILSLTAGVVVALASSIGFALAGAVGALAAVALPAAAAIGVLLVAFRGLSKAQKAALKVTFKPLVNEFKDLRKAAQSGVFTHIGDTAKKLVPVVRELKPLFHKVGASIADVGLGWSKAMGGAGFKTFVDTMTKFLPHAVESLGKSLGNALGGVGGLFRGLVPFMNTVLGYIQKITGKFDTWANSAGGQNQIKRFFDNALTSLKAFGGFLGSVGGLLAQVMSQGRSTGDSIFKSMTTAIDGWTTKLKDNPDILKGWFDSAKKFATEVGNVIVGIGKLWGALDTPATRQLATKVFAALAIAIGLIADAINTIGPDGSARLAEIGGAMFLIGKGLKVLAGLRLAAVALGLMGPAGAAAGAGLATAGAGAEVAATGFAGLSAAAIGIPAAIAIAGGFAVKYAVGLDKIDTSQGRVTRSMQELAQTGKTSGFGNVSRTYGAAIPLLDKLSHGFLNLKRPAQDIGTILHGAAFTDMPKIFAPGAVSAVGQMDTALSHMSRNDAGKAFSGIVKQGAKAGVSLEQVRALFPKFTAQQKVWDAQSGAIMTRQSVRLTASMDDWWLLGKRMSALPKAVTTIMSQPGMVTSLGDIKSLAAQYHLTPDKVLTLIAATGAAKTIGDVKKVRTEFHLTPKQVTTLLTLTGAVKTLADVDRYVKALHLTPKERTTIMRVLGIHEALPSVKEINDKLKGLPREVISRIEMHGGKLSKQQLEDVVLSSGKLNGKQIRAIVSLLGIKISKTELATLIKLADIANKRRIKMKADLDTSKFDAARRRTMAAVQALDAKRPKPKADLDTGKFAAANKKAMSDVTNLDKQRPKPKANLDHSGFDAGKARVGIGVADMDRLRANPKVTVHADTSALAGVRAEIAGIQGKTVFVRIQRLVSGPGGGRSANPGGTAVGGVFGGMANFAQTRLIGEAGPEAVVPLNRPLGQVDPAVRWLSAIAQGKIPAMASGGVVGGGRTVNVGGISVYSPNSDARAVATEVVNRLVSTGY